MQREMMLTDIRRTRMNMDPKAPWWLRTPRVTRVFPRRNSIRTFVFSTHCICYLFGTVALQKLIWSGTPPLGYM